MWISGLAQYQSLSIEDPAQGEVDDPYFNGNVSVGYRIIKGSAAVSEGLHTNRLPHGPFSADLYDARRRTEFSVWATYNPIRLLGDEELANLLPIGSRFDYVSVSARVDLHIRQGLGAKLEGTYGKNVDVGGETFWNIDAAVTWRPHRRLELLGGVAFGISQGRTDDSDSIAARLGLTYRW